MERPSAGTAGVPRLGSELLIEAQQKVKKLGALLLNVAHLNGLLAW